MVALAATTADGWHAGIGDPTFMGWFTVAAYFAAAYLCYRAYRIERGIAVDHRPPPKPARLWFWLAVCFIGLGINKQLDLQSLFTQIGRDISKSQGWYASRRSVQWEFIIALMIIGSLTIGWLFWTLRDSFRTHRLAFIGAAFLMMFIVIRAASFHRFDEFLGWDIFGFAMNWLLELGGIACVAVGAAQRDPVIRNWVRRPHFAQLQMSWPWSGRPRRVKAVHTHRATRGQSSRNESFQWMVNCVRDRRSPPS